MNRRIPYKFSGGKRRRLSRLLLKLLSGTKFPVLVAATALLIVLIFWLFGSGAEAKPIISDTGRKPFGPVCRWCGEIKKDESLYLAITNAGMRPRVVYDINLGLDSILDTRKVMPGDIVTVDSDSTGMLVRFELVRAPWEKYLVINDNDSLTGFKDSIALTYILRAAKGEVKNTLWESMASLGVPAEAILKFTDILSYDVDFLTETRDGQKFALIYEEYLFEGEVVDIGRVMAAQYWMPDTNYAGIFYEDPDTIKGYYTLAGKNTKKALLRTPLTYRRISSYFSHSRFHPILKIHRPHLGIDYAAPVGTPVSASGDGKIIYAGWKGGYGKFIEIKHDCGNIHTMYGHLSRFASGIRTGARVRQGQLIGYVGSTGLSTGPHLDYRVTVNGNFVNPLKYAFPDGPPVNKQYMTDFLATAESYLMLLDMLKPPVTIAGAEKPDNLTSLRGEPATKQSR